MPDPLVNFGEASLAVAGVAANATSLTLASGQGSRFPDPAALGEYDLTVFDSTVPGGVAAAYWASKAKMVRVTAKAGDVLTVVDGAQGTSTAAILTADSVVLSFSKGTYEQLSRRLITIPFASLSSNPVDGQTIYFGNPNLTPDTTNFSRQWFYSPYSGSIVAAVITLARSNSPSSEPWPMSVRIQNATDYLIGNANAASGNLIVSNLIIPVTAGQSLVIRADNPTWATNPTGFLPFGYLVLETNP